MQLERIEEVQRVLNMFMEEYQIHISAFLGITVLTCFLTMIYHITRLGIAGSSDNDRTTAIKGILVSGCGLAVLGSISLWYFLLVSTTSGL